MASARKKRIVWSYDTGDSSWVRFADIDNEIVEAAYRRNEKKEVELDEAFVDLPRRIQKKKRNLTIEQPIKREELVLDQNNLRPERFYTEPKLVKAFSDSDSNDRRFLKEWQRRHARASTDELLELTASGILLEGRVLNQSIEAEWITSELRAMKGKSNPEINKTLLSLYTRESFLYRLINATLRDNDHSKLDNLGAFSRLLFHCDCSPDLRSLGYQGELYRGAQLNEETIQSYEAAVGKVKTWDAFSSTSKIRATAESFGNVLFIINRAKTTKYRFSGMDISSISAYPEEEEVLIRAARDFLVEKVERNDKKDKYLIYLALC
jgi:hypothetical protein